MQKTKETIRKILKTMLTEPINSFMLWDLNKKVEKMLKELDLYEIPIDIERLAYKLGLEDIKIIPVEDFNTSIRPFSGNELAGYYSNRVNRYENGQWNATIRIKDLPPGSSRYYISTMLGTHLLYKDEKIYEDAYFLGKLSTTQEQEIEKEFALALLMPIGLFVSELDKQRKDIKARYKDITFLNRRLSERFVVLPEITITRLMEVSRILIEIKKFSNDEEVQKLVNEYIKLFE